jgi:hypothetical protein
MALSILSPPLSIEAEFVSTWRPNERKLLSMNADQAIAQSLSRLRLSRLSQKSLQSEVSIGIYTTYTDNY